MSDLMQLLQQSLGEEGVSALSQRIGADQQATKSAIGAALPALVGGLSRQGEKAETSAGLLQFLDSDGDGEILDDIQGFLSGNRATSTNDLLGQVLGGRHQRVEQGVSKASGLDAATTQKLLGLLAPIVLGALAKQKKTQGLDAGGLKDFLGKERASVEQQTGGMIGKILDQDGDGDFDLGDVAKLAVGQLFGKK